nr:GAK system XXXCH domain-containing protein [Desulfobulbaceae bacterium]
MDPKKITIQKTLERTQIAAFLRLLATEIEGGSSEGLQDFGVDLHNFNKIKVGLVKRAGGQLELKLKIKDGAALKGAEEAATELEDASSNSYKLLKNKMSQTFKTIGRAVSEKRLPPAETVESFLREVEQMVSFPGFGDEYYDEFINLCRELERRYAEGKIEAVVELHGRILSQTKQCHRRYK